MQVRIKVLVAANTPLLAEPVVVFEPDHEPEAMHCVASVDDHVSVTELPLTIEDALADRLTVGAD